MDDLRYPIGRFARPASLTAEERAPLIQRLESAPGELARAVAGLSDAQLDTPYRAEGWTIRQVVHHVPDSHLNAYIRFRLALTEEAPLAKTYDEAEWARLEDARCGPVDVSLRLVAALHERWTRLLESLSEAHWARVYRHPELGDVRLDAGLALYAWHGAHHIAHVTRLRERMGWGPPAAR